MRFSYMSLLVLCMLGAACTSAFAMSPTDYASLRAAQSVSVVDASQPLAPQFSRLAGRVAEIDGTVEKVIAQDTTLFVVLKDAAGETFMVSVPPADKQIALGDTLRALAPIPAAGTTLQALGTLVVRKAPVAIAPTAASTLSNVASANVGPGTTTEAAHQITTLAEPQPTDGMTTTQPSEQAVSAPTPDQTDDADTTTSDVPSSGAKAPARSDTSNLHSRNFRLLVTQVQQSSHHISTGLATSIVTHVVDKSQQYQVDPRLVLALIAQESHFNPQAVSPTGAAGLGQLMPGTASRLGVRHPFDVEENINGTVKYLAQQLKTFHGNVNYALAAYNAGPGNVTRYGGVPPFRETRHYVQTISTHYQKLTSKSLGYD